MMKYEKPEVSVLSFAAGERLAAEPEEKLMVKSGDNLNINSLPEIDEGFEHW